MMNSKTTSAASRSKKWPPSASPASPSSMMRKNGSRARKSSMLRTLIRRISLVVDRADGAAADGDRVAVDRHAPGRGEERHHRRDLVGGHDPADGDGRPDLPLDLVHRRPRP